MKKVFIWSLFIFGILGSRAYAYTDVYITGIGAAVSIASPTFTGDVDIDGALTGTSAAFSTTLSVTGNSYLGAANYKSTNTASSGAWTFPATISVGGTASVTGDSYLGAANFKSTNTASTGVWAFPADVGIGGALTGTSAALSTTLSVTGNSYLGAANYKSTNTASSGAWDFPATVNIIGALDSNGQTTLGADNTVSTITAAGIATFNTSVGVPTTGMVFVGLRTMAQLTAATAVMGEMGICSDCTPVEIFISTAAGAPNTGGYGNAVGLQLD